MDTKSFSVLYRAGYISNYEIFQYLNQVDNPEFYGNISVTQYEDQGDVLIIDGDNWISWLSPHSYELRKQWTDSLGFGGTSDWAIDLNQTYTNNGTGNEVDLYDDFELCDYTMTYGSLDDLSSAADGMRADCLAFYTMQVLIDMLDKAYDNYTNVNDGYDELFGYYVTYMNDLVPQILETELMLVGSGDEGISTPAGITFGPGMACKKTFRALKLLCMCILITTSNQILTATFPTAITTHVANTTTKRITSVKSGARILLS